ncbi:murein transglycosylase A [Candidatus Profftia tarda]|uniref:peptidoglycan lytic exotransglycosylase n=1 Tax=Candidatus Profftia tarda TaxID=1177216 RepID=A0A8E4F0X1_9ENTR|nr:murein transglycosylase A [Candidatus Profftia tarda]CAD6506889.1 Membrane-bound lytic murein transglycosylase A [Candidatus Profftia tarda]
MSSYFKKYIIFLLLLKLLTGCALQKTRQGKQFIDGKIKNPLKLVSKPNIKGKLVNQKDFSDQIIEIKRAAPLLYKKNYKVFKAVNKWLKDGAHIVDIPYFGFKIYQMAGTDNFGNVQFTSYYTPVTHARYTRQGKFQYPFYRMPYHKSQKHHLPNRAEIYAGILENHNLVLGYSNSLLDNFIMEIQGSGYVDYGDGRPLTFLRYAGENGYAYRSIGKIMTDLGYILPERISMKTIRKWADRHNADEVRALLEHNPSFIFFNPQMYPVVKGASGVPLIANSALACDRSLIPEGSTLLVELPLLNDRGNFMNHYEIRLMAALDVGGAIKGQHCDIYQGIGGKAGQKAGFYNHYGRVWLLKMPEKTICKLITGSPKKN